MLCCVSVRVCAPSHPALFLARPFFSPLLQSTQLFAGGLSLPPASPFWGFVYHASMVLPLVLCSALRRMTTAAFVAIRLRGRPLWAIYLCVSVCYAKKITTPSTALLLAAGLGGLVAT